MKFLFIEAHRDEHSVVKMCGVLNVSTSGFYKWRGKQRDEKTIRERQKADVKQKISQSFHESFGTYGSPRVHHDLIEWGYTLSQKTVARYMKELKLSAKTKVKYVVTTDSNHGLKVFPNLMNRQFKAYHPNTKWVTDITYVRTVEGWLYIATVMDLFSRKIVGIHMAASMDKELVITALKRALSTRQPPKGFIHHSDQGSQYCSSAYLEVIEKAQAKISMSRKGDPYDNACIESFHATIKKELIYRVRFETRKEAMKVINHYIFNVYNTKRKHSSLGYQSPNQYEQNYLKSLS
ncbi:IS3 family transposase [Alkalihalobacillus sp. FSL W8-0930]